MRSTHFVVLVSTELPIVSYPRELLKSLAKKPEDLKIIVCHLGNGSSITAVDKGKSVDTSMGLTPLGGVIMGTRCGDVDPTVVEYIAQKENLSLSEAMTVLNKKSGVLGISGVSSDFRDLGSAAADGNERADLALKAFVHTVVKTIGSYAAVMNGVDVIVFTAGIGENDISVRAKILENFGYLGLTLDPIANDIRGEERIISTADSKVKAMVVPTNEELAICRDTVEIVTKMAVEEAVKEVLK
jgi:acetate kinase